MTDQTALVLAPNLTSLDVSQPLWRLLSSGRKENIQEIAESPQLRAEALSISSHLAELARECGETYVQKSLATLVLVFGLGEQAEAPGFWKAYNEQLAPLPRIALDRAIMEYNGKGKFFPKPAELKELADPHAHALRQSYSRTREVAKINTDEVNKRDKRTPEERAAVAKMLGEFNELMATKEIKEAPPKRHAVHSPVDQAGVTAEGRALIERMKQQR